MSDSEADASSPKHHMKYSKKCTVPTRALIPLVEERRLLWDRAHAQYRDKAAKEQAWRAIFLEIEPAFDSLSAAQKLWLSNMIVKKWNNVRDAYVKSLKPSNRHKAYLYAEELQFLDTMLSKKNYQDSFDERISNGREDEDNNELTENWMSQVFVDIDEEHSEPTRKRVKQESSASRDVPEYDENIVSVLVNLIQREEDEDRAFFKSITPAVKQLSQSSKFEFRIQVMKLIGSLKMKEKQPLKHRTEITSNGLSESE